MPAKRDSALYSHEYKYFTAYCPFCKEKNVISEPGSEFGSRTCEHFRGLNRITEEATFYESEEKL
jgi:hypothetical protein